MRRSAALATHAPLRKGRTDRHSVASPFSFTIFRFFRVLRVFFKKTLSGARGSAPHIHSPSCRGAGRGAPHKSLLGYTASLYRYTFFRCSLPFPFTPVRFFRVSGTFSQKSTRAGCGASPHIYTLLHVGARGGASHIFLFPWSGRGAAPHIYTPHVGVRYPIKPSPYRVRLLLFFRFVQTDEHSPHEV